MIIRKCSEHGLGMRLDPTDPDAPVSAAEVDEAEPIALVRPARKWVQEFWSYLIECELGREVAEPDWFDLPALCKLTITRPDLAARLRLPPFNFCLVAQVQALQSVLSVGEPSLRLVAPFERDSRRWLRMRWFDAHTKQTFRIATGTPDGYAMPGVVYVKSYRDVAREFLSRPETKFATPDGRPCPRRYRGRLVSRRVSPREEVNIGKEATHIEDLEAGLLGVGDVLAVYERPRTRDAAFDRYVRRPSSK